MNDSLRALADVLTEYLNEILEDEQLTVNDVLDALASLGLTLVEDPIAESSFTYYESVQPQDQDL